MKLYFFPVAPNPTKVRLYLAEKAAAGTEIELTEVLVSLPKGEQRAPSTSRATPSAGFRFWSSTTGRT